MQCSRLCKQKQKNKEPFLIFKMDAEKRERKRNFSQDETRILREEFEIHKDILESKLTNTVTNSRKNAIWKSILDKINSLGYEKRIVDEVKNKWRNICSTAKTTWAEYKRERVKTGGGTPPRPSVR